MSYRDLKQQRTVLLSRKKNDSEREKSVGSAFISKGGLYLTKFSFTASSLPRRSLWSKYRAMQGRGKKHTQMKPIHSSHFTQNLKTIMIHTFTMFSTTYAPVMTKIPSGDRERILRHGALKGNSHWSDQSLYNSQCVTL